MEGYEYIILKGLFKLTDRITIGAIALEILHYKKTDTYDKLRVLLTENDYYLHGMTDLDEWWVHKSVYVCPAEPE